MKKDNLVIKSMFIKKNKLKNLELNLDSLVVPVASLKII